MRGGEGRWEEMVKKMGAWTTGKGPKEKERRKDGGGWRGRRPVQGRERVIRERLQKEGLVDVYVYARIHPHYPATATTLPDLPTTADRITDRNSCTACMRLQGGRVLTVCYRDRAVFL